MLIIGHKLLENYDFFMSNDELKENMINCFYYDENLINKAKCKNIDFAIIIKNYDELILSNALGAKFILIEDISLALQASKIAEFYMFDSKVLLIIDELKNLNDIYELRLDGVLLKSKLFNA